MPKAGREEFLQRIKVDIPNGAQDKYAALTVKKSVTDDESANKDAREKADDRGKEADDSRYQKGSRRSSDRNAWIVKDHDFKHNCFMKQGSREQQKLIEKILGLETKHLNIAPPHILYKLDASKEAEFGSAGRNEIEINLAKFNNSEEGYRELLCTICHEVRHIYQNRVEDHKKEHPEISRDERNYVRHSEIIYPKDTDPAYDEKYLNNGLEVDSEAYAMSRMYAYYDLEIENVLSLEQAPQTRKNQILQTRLGQGAGIEELAVGKDYRAYQERRKNNQQVQSKKNEEKREGMAHMTGTDLSERAVDEAVKNYGEVVELIHNQTLKAINAWENGYENTPSLQMKKSINTFIGYCNEVPKEIVNAINSWANSDNGLSNSLSDQQEGEEDASVASARRLEERMKECVSEKFKQIELFKKSLPESTSKDEIMTVSEVINDYVNVLSGLKENCVAQFEKMGQTNSIYSNLAEVVALSFVQVETHFRAAYKDVLVVGEEHRESTGKIVSRGSQSATSAKGKILATDFTSRRKRR